MLVWSVKLPVSHSQARTKNAPIKAVNDETVTPTTTLPDNVDFAPLEAFCTAEAPVATTTLVGEGDDRKSEPHCDERTLLKLASSALLLGSTSDTSTVLDARDGCCVSKIEYAAWMHSLQDMLEGTLIVCPLNIAETSDSIALTLRVPKAFCQSFRRSLTQYVVLPVSSKHIMSRSVG